MHPNYGNFYENYEQRKNMVNPVFNSHPMNENYYQRAPSNPPYNNEQSYYEMKYPVQAAPPVYPSYNPNPTISNVNPPQPSASYSYGNQPAPREDVSFYLQSFENYFQQHGLYDINNSSNQRNPARDYNTYNNGNNGMNNPSYPLNTFNNNSSNSAKPSNNPYYKYPLSYPQQYQQPSESLQRQPNSIPTQNYQQPPHDPNYQYVNKPPQDFIPNRRHSEKKRNEKTSKFRPDNKQEYKADHKIDSRERFRKKHIKYTNKRRSSESSESRSRSSRSSKSHSHSPNEKRRSSDSMKKNAAFKKMLKDKNNWECPNCKNLNFSKRIRCNRCHKNRPSSSIKEFIDNRKFVKNLGGPPGLFREGDWACSKCDNINFAKRQCCNRCGKEKDSSDTVGVIKNLGRKKTEHSSKNLENEGSKEN